MGEEKQKTYLEWQGIVGSIDDKQFEEICYRLLDRLGFEEVKPRGGSADGGRDLEGYKTYTEPDKKTSFKDRYWFECKCYSSTIPWKEMCDKLVSAESEKIDKFVILSNMGLSPTAQDNVRKFAESKKLRVIEWCGFKFLDLLFQQPDLCDTYFHGIPIPLIPPKEDKPKHILKAVLNLGEGFGLELKKEVKPNFQPTEQNIKPIILETLRKIGTQEIRLSDEDKARLFCNIAMTFSQFGLNLDAMTFIDKSLQLQKSYTTLINKAVILERSHNFPESTKIYREILKTDKNNLTVLNNLARNLKNQYLLKESLIIVNKALEVEPNHIPSIDLKIHILKDLKKYEEVIKIVNERIKDTSSIVLQKTKVDVLLEAYDLKEAFRINEQLLSLDPSDVDLINNKGVIYEHNSQHQHREKYLKLAFESFAEARTKKEDYMLALSNQVVCFLNAGNLPEAESLTNAGLALTNSSPFLWHNKAKIEMQKSNFKAAREYIEKALRISSQEKFIITKAQILISLRQYDAVDKLCRQIIDIDENNQDVMLMLTEALKKRNRVYESQKWIKKAKLTTRKYISLLE